MKSKILLITLNFPYPLNHGGAIAQYYFIEKLASENELTLLTQSNSNEQTFEFKLLSKKIPKLKLYILENQTKIDTSNNILQFFRLIKFKIWKLRIKYNREFVKPSLNLKFVEFVKKHLDNFNYDIIQCDFFETLPLLDFLSHYSKTVFVHHEILSKRLETEGNKSNDYINQVVNYEANQLRKADKVVVFNKYDKEKLNKFLDTIIISPFGIPEELVTKLKPSKTFSKFIVIGGESHKPNKDGLSYFLDEIYIPNIDKLFQVNIVGKWSIDFRNKYANYSKIVFTGFLDSLDNVYEEGILIAPIFTGSGIRTKILLAMSNQIPILTTSFAAEGLFDTNNSNHFGFFENENDFVGHFEQFDLDGYFSNLATEAYNYYIKNFNSDYLLDLRKESFIF